MIQTQNNNLKIKQLKEQIEQLPVGNLICAQNGNYYKWYISDGHSKTYLPKSHQQLAEKLALKKYLSLQLEDLKNEELANKHYLKHISHSNKAQKLLLHSEYRSLLSSYFKPLAQELTEWQNESYERNFLHPEHLTHKCPSGNTVRSKSEASIDTLLYMHQIPFRYECALTLGNAIIFPDFTIRHPLTGEYYYWEHFGLMDDQTYAKNACSKILLYSTHGIVPSIHLITTYETKDYPLSTDTVEKIIQHYFLNNLLIE